SIERAQTRHPDLHKVRSEDSRAHPPLYVHIQDSAALSPILWSSPRHFPSAGIVTMRGRTFRRPLTTTRDGRARGRGGRLPGDESLTCPPVAAAHRSTARGGAPTGRPSPAALR